MSVLKNYKVSTVKFTNESHDTIEVLWEDENNVTRSFYLPATEPDNPDYKYLESIGWDHEAIIKSSAEYVKSEVKALKDIYRFMAKGEIEKIEQKYSEQFKSLAQAEIEKSNIITSIIENNEDDEAVFRAKLAVFELPAIKKSKSKTLKTNIRKCKTLIEVLSLLKGKI